MSSNFPAILEGIRARFQAVVGVPAYGYDPKVYPSDMHVRFIAARGTPIPAPYGTRGKKWTFTGRLVVRYTNNETAEAQIAAKIPALDAALGQDLDAGESLADERDGQADTEELIWRYLTVGQTDYRVVDFTVTATEFYPFTYGL